MTTATRTALTTEQHEAIAKGVLDDHKRLCGGLLKSLDIDSSTPIADEDKYFILFYAMLTEWDQDEKLMKADTIRGFMVNLCFLLNRKGREAKREQVLKQCEGANIVCFSKFDGTKSRLVLHRSTRTDTDREWQLTSIGYDGMPWGHNNPPSFEEGLFCAVGAGTVSYWNEHGYSYEWSDNLGTKPPF